MADHILKQSHVLTIDKKGKCALSNKDFSLLDQISSCYHNHTMAILAAFKNFTIYKNRKKKNTHNMNVFCCCTFVVLVLALVLVVGAFFYASVATTHLHHFE